MRKEEENQKDLARCSQNSAQSGTPDSVRCARLVSGEKAALGKRSAAYSYNSPDYPVVHRTVRWANGRQRNGRPHNPRATRGPHQRSAGGTGLSGAPSGPKLHRSTAPYLEGNRAPDSYINCPVVHRTVRCTTQQKARLAFQDCLQRLLASLGL
jgi:hypothetical protein